MPLPTTPQPGRKDDPNIRETEKWTDLSAVVYTAGSTTPITGVAADSAAQLVAVEVPCSIPCRLEITGRFRWSAETGATAYRIGAEIWVDGTVVSDGSQQRFTVASTGDDFVGFDVATVDVVAGTHTVALYVRNHAGSGGAAAAEDHRLIVRRGTKPSTL